MCKTKTTYRYITGILVAIVGMMTASAAITPEPRPLVEWNPAIGFRYTNGITDPANHQYSEKIKNWCDWSGWVDGKWTKDEDYLRQAGIKMPDFSFLTNSQWENDLAFMLPAGEKRQPTHTIEHTVYAIPGRPVVLYPYYEMERQARENYCLRYTHWYDWLTGDTPSTIVGGEKREVIDFRVDPIGIYKSDKNGYFGIPGLNGYDLHIKTPQEWISFANYVNAIDATDDRFGVRVLIDADLDFAGLTDVPQLAWSGRPFHGVIDGGGHTIKNFICAIPQDAGFVKLITGGCEIRNLNFDSSCKFSADSRGAAVVGSVNNERTDDIIISNIYSEAEVTSTASGAWAMGGLLGYNINFKGKFVIKDCRIRGKVMPVGGFTPSSKDSFTGLGCFGSAPVAEFTNLLVDPELPTPPSGNKQAFAAWSGLTNVTVKNCYYEAYDRSFTKYKNTEAENLTALGSGFEMQNGLALPKTIILHHEPVEVPRTACYATTPVFLYPAESDKLRAGSNQSLPEEYVIAADFSQSFTVKDNMTKVGDTYTEMAEPVIHFRHIFHVKDGCALAREMSGDADANANYLRTHTRILAARKQKDLQVRLANSYPTRTGSESGLYYITQSDEYMPTGGVAIRVFDRYGNPISNEYSSTDESGAAVKANYFTLDSKVKAYGPVKVGDTEYVREDDEYARMLCFQDPQGNLNNVDRFIVELIALDLDGNVINIKGSSSPLIVERYEIDMLGESRASFVTANEFYSEANDDKYADYRPEALESAPNTRKHDQIDFDEYRNLTLPDAPKSSAIDGSDYVMGSGDKFWYKWPMTLTQGEYAFGYDRAASPNRDERYEYNEYVIATHSDIVPWKSGVTAVGDGELYDRYWYESKRRNREQQPGFFYYVNAASDPGSICTLRAKDICMGSTVRVSAWIAEFSPYKPDLFEGKYGMTETANVAFTFQAVKGNGERVNIHTFVTGYVAENYGQWMHVYYEFTPRTADFDLLPQDIDHFELLLVNNCRSSNGGDYAIDDITVYIQNPTVIAHQQSEVCKPTDENFEVRIGAPFEALLQVLYEKADTDKEMEIYYTFIDKEIFDQKYEQYSHDRRVIDAGERAWEESVVRYDYDSNGDNDAMFGTLRFNTTFSKNLPYEHSCHYSELASKYTEDGVDYIVFNTFPKDSHLRAEKEYYISMFVKNEEEMSDWDWWEPGWWDFNITLPCTLQSVFTVTPTSVIKIDGDIHDDDSRTEYCQNQQPTVQINLKGYDPETGEILVVDPDARFDWYDGTLEEYYAEERNGVLLSDALFHLHAAYPELDDIDFSLQPKGGLTAEMIEYILDLTHPEAEDAKSRLTLSRRSFTFPPLQIPEAYDEKGELIDHGKIYVLAIPIEHITDTGEEEYRICTIPTQIGLFVREKSPYITHGFKDIPYPARILDAPLRASLKQLQAASATPSSDYMLHDVKLNVPIRRVEFSGCTEAVDMRRPTSKEGIINADLSLIWTDDPEYEHLGTEAPDSPSDTSRAASPRGLLVAGEITKIKATGADGFYDEFECVFDNTFKFKEGYSYQFKFPFEEDNDLRNERCPGQEIFTIKVVPEYLKWTAETNLNFNNDANWRRVETKETYSVISDSNTEYFTDGSNSRAKAFAPLDFTKVIIDNDVVVPHLFSIEEKNVSGVKKFDNEIAPWSATPSARSAAEDMTGYVYTFNPDRATYDVEYDLACFRDGYIWCRPWYANTCEQIHFLPYSAIIGQGWLKYNRAWVDIQLSPYYWHLISSPMKEAFAGDFYLPTLGAQQKSPLFEDICFKETLNNRFAPAVYQRGYRLGSATVYQLDNTTMNVAYEPGWTNVFNDVQACYGANGDIAFSIKTDPSDATGRQPDDDVVFRLPKGDTEYTYYDRNNNAPNPLTSPIARTDDHYRLNDAAGEIRARVKSTSRFVLVGNPLMTHLDIKSFLKANEDVIEQKYWVINELSQFEGMFDNMNPDEPLGNASGFMPPMKAFFVQLKNGVTLPICDAEHDEALLTLKYDPSMACIGEEKTISERKGIRISAISDGVEVSSATIVVDENADMASLKEKCMPLLDQTRSLGLPAAAYAISDNQAMSIAHRKDISGTEIGVSRLDNLSPLSIRIEGIDEAENLCLYNSSEDTYTPIYDGMEYDIKGQQSGLYIVRRAAAPEEMLTGSIVWRCNRGEVVVTATSSDAPLNVNVADTEGRMVASVAGEGECRITLSPGIYILNAEDTKSSLTVKIVVK